MKRTALVTGANRGLGREVCRQLEARGFEVIATSRDLGFDVTAPGLVVPKVDVLVNNAGVALKGFDAEVCRKTLAVNFFGALAVTDAALKVGVGHVVMVSSGMGELSVVGDRLRAFLTRPAVTRDEVVALMRDFPRDFEAVGWPASAYRTSKVGLNALTRVLARDLHGRVRVNAVCPGWVRTDMGGPNAERTVEVGAASIVSVAASDDGGTGGFFRDGHSIPW